MALTIDNKSLHRAPGTGMQGSGTQGTPTTAPTKVPVTTPTIADTFAQKAAGAAPQQTGSAPRSLPSTPVPTAATAPLAQPVRRGLSRDAAAPPRTDIAARLGGQVTLSTEQREAIGKLGPDERQMMVAALDEIDALRAGKINAAQYQANVLDHAARIAGNDGEKFVDLAGMIFSPGSMGAVFDGVRRVSGEDPHSAGGAVEEAHMLAVAGQGGPSSLKAGFNPNVLDNEDPGSTITHHYGAFLQVGGNRTAALGKMLAGVWDSADSNPGDVRNGRFAAMLGDAVASGHISPADGARLHRWAFVAHDGPQPPWGKSIDAKGSPEQSTSMEDFQLKDWVSAFNKAHPEAPIKRPAR